MSDHVISHTKIRIREGGLEPYTQFQDELVRFVDANHPRVIAYSAHFNEDGTEARSVQVHPDSESFELHLELAASQIHDAAKYLEVVHFEVLGNPSDSLRAKFEAFGEPHSDWPLAAGFIRSATG